MIKGMLKKDVKKLLSEERKKMRAKAKESKFMQKTLNIYKNQKARAKELKADSSDDTIEQFSDKVDYPNYTLEELRDYVMFWLGAKCAYCDRILTIRNFTADHRIPVSRGGEFTLANTAPCCQPCNCQKGKMNDEEFDRLNEFLKTLPEEIAKDVRARLTTGGRWMPH